MVVADVELEAYAALHGQKNMVTPLCSQDSVDGGNFAPP